MSPVRIYLGHCGIQFLPKETPHNMLQQPCRLLLNKLRNHIAKHCAYRVETLVCSTDVIQSMVIEKYLLHNEYGHSFAKLGASLHDAQAQRDNFRCKKKVYDIGGVILDKRTDDTEGGQSQVFKRSGLRGSIKEGV